MASPWMTQGGMPGMMQTALHMPGMPGMPRMPHMFSAAPSPVAAGVVNVMAKERDPRRGKETRFGPDGFPVDESTAVAPGRSRVSIGAWQMVYSVVFPWLASVVCVLLFTLFYEHLSGLVLILVNAWIVLCLGFYIQNRHYERHERAWVFAACAGTIAAGSIAGWWNYDMYLRDFWDYYDRREYTNVWPTELAEGHRDASAIVFAPGTKPDPLSSMGFNFGYSTACVAPIRMPGDENVGTIQYWAAGVDCCSEQGTFTCDDMKVAGTHAGLVIFGRGEPLIPFFQASVTTTEYLQAVKMASARFGIQSAALPIFVHWVRDIEAAHGALWVEAWLFWLKSSFAALGLCLALAFLSPTVVTQARLQILKIMTKTNA